MWDEEEEVIGEEEEFNQVTLTKYLAPGMVQQSYMRDPSNMSLEELIKSTGKL